MKTILSGIQPSGKPHIGNYFGMMKQMIDMQKDGLVYAVIVDYHALNSVQDAEKMREFTKDVVIDYLALGFDPKKHVLFKQSDVSAHTELAWIFDTITTLPYLKRAHAYKDAIAKGGEDEISIGRFSYPMLMAADILLYDPDLIPVGKDQKQHVEFARDTAEKFNRIFCKESSPLFKLPEAHIIESVETVPGTDGRKMSKSYGNYIPLFAEDDEVEDKVMSIVTDSNAEYPENVFKIHQLFRTNEQLDKIYTENKGKYKILKEMLAADIKSFIKPLREKRKEIASDIDRVKKVLEEGKQKASAVAEAKMAEVKRAIGVT
ncbi:MAG TPA: tryptophan--tRNA ligase [Candidatus Paceibacterota bacterium]